MVLAIGGRRFFESVAIGVPGSLHQVPWPRWEDQGQDRPAVAEIRDALGTTRKFALPICAILDSTGVTRRREDLRIPGPRLPDL